MLFGVRTVQLGLGERNKGYKNLRDQSLWISTWRHLGLFWNQRIKESLQGSQKGMMFWGKGKKSEPMLQKAPKELDTDRSKASPEGSQAAPFAAWSKWFTAGLRHRLSPPRRMLRAGVYAKPRENEQWGGSNGLEEGPENCSGSLPGQLTDTSRRPG